MKKSIALAEKHPRWERYYIHDVLFSKEFGRIIVTFLRITHEERGVYFDR